MNNKKEQVKSSPVQRIVRLVETTCCRALLRSAKSSQLLGYVIICSVCCGIEGVPRHRQNGHAINCFCKVCQPEPQV